ncbi:hypothetical protein CJ483_21460 [Bacillus sp. PK3_68]|nr:hypothetical protein CJ483_21460 [Bacillus sp. PK3_68]
MISHEHPPKMNFLKLHKFQNYIPILKNISLFCNGLEKNRLISFRQNSTVRLRKAIFFAQIPSSVILIYNDIQII